MRVPVTTEEMREAIQTMHLALPKFGLTPDTLPQIVRVYREVLESFDGETVHGAAMMLLKSEDRFPSPSRWRDTCIAWLKHNRIVLEREPELDGAGNDIVCRICRSVPRWARLSFLPTPFSASLRMDGEPPSPEVVRRIAVCDRSRHPTPHGVTDYPSNFIAWAS